MWNFVEASYFFSFKGLKPYGCNIVSIIDVFFYQRLFLDLAPGNDSDYAEIKYLGFSKLPMVVF